MSKNRAQRIVILGAGFGGVHAFAELHKQFHKTEEVDITIINDGDRFIFTPLIHEVATGTLLPAGVMEPLRTLPGCCLDRFIDGRAHAIDFDKQTVTVQHNRLMDMPESHGHIPARDNETVEYDYLILGLGSETNFFDIPGAEEHSLQLKDLKDARRMKNNIIESFEKASTMDDPDQQKAALTFAVVGGGPTGVEIAGELADFLNGELGDAFKDVKDLARIVIIDRGDRLLKMVDPWFGKKAHAILEKKADVYHMYETSVTGVTANGVDTDKGFVHAHTVIWSAGVRARSLDFTHTKDIAFEDRTRRLKVDRSLHLVSYDTAFVIGDQAWVCDIESGQPYPMRAQFASREGSMAAKNIAHHLRGEKLEPFHWKDRGFIVSLGKGGGLASAFGIKFTGVFAWFVYRTVYLMSLISWRSRLRTALEWTLNIFLPRDISKL